MFLGSYRTLFSGKNRLILPKRFRKELGSVDKFYILLGGNGEIWGFDTGNWLNLTEGILKVPLFTGEGRIQRLRLFPKAEECSLDGQGRFILPQEFIKNLDLNIEVMIIGAGDHFEIWNIDIWKKQLKEVEKEHERVS